MNSVTSILDAPLPPRLVRPLIASLERIAVGTLRLETPEGYELRFGDGGEPQADLQLKQWSALRHIFRYGDIGLAECYRDGLVKTSDLTQLIRLGIRNQTVLERAIHGNPLLGLGSRLRHLLRRNSRRGSARNIQAHYDLGNEFYRLWLDPSMTYSSACFDDRRGADLMQAQQVKYRRMLDLVGARPGDSILEIGCGWGGFAEYAASEGIRVHGVTLSHEQLAYARERIQQAGLQELACFELRDYRDLQGRYDHIVSIEMLEAVGEAYWAGYFRRIHELLRPGGRAALQSIVIDESHFARYRRSTDFIQQYIFPGGMLPSPARIVEQAQAQGLRVERIDSFGADYAETLRRWRWRFDANREAVLGLGFDSTFIRLWRFYLAYCEAGFEEGRIDLLQVGLEKGAAR
ncbi:MAG: cyclopropane-fatty-acyl-phospholipid synthase family protein [Chromatiales bacterium]